jgi:hypothetical protein
MTAFVRALMGAAIHYTHTHCEKLSVLFKIGMFSRELVFKDILVLQEYHKECSAFISGFFSPVCCGLTAFSPTMQ